MTDYFSDREFGPKPKVEETIDEVVWQAILSLVETRIDDGSLGYGFPSHCPDGNAIDGTDRQAVTKAIRAEIRDLAARDGENHLGVHDWRPLPDNVPETATILDLVVFVARNVAQPTRRGWHDFFSHHHLELDRAEGLRKFVEDINRLFSRNGLAYTLTDSGTIERTVPAPVAERLKRTGFRTGDQELDDLLDNAVKRILSPKPEAGQDALEKLWDAFERLKTIEAPGNKRAAANMLIDKATASAGAVFRSAVEEEFRALTKFGNELRIRHSEVGQEPVGDKGEKDYLFMRLFSLIWLMLKGTGRLSEVRNDRPDEDDEEAPF